MDYSKHFEISQECLYLYIDGVRYKRLAWGQESSFPSDLADKPCHDCGAIRGQYHSLLCDMERCPKCGEQEMSCDCNGKTSALFSPKYWIRWLLAKIGFNVKTNAT